MTFFKAMGWFKNVRDKSLQMLSNSPLPSKAPKTRVDLPEVPALLEDNSTGTAPQLYRSILLHKWTLAKTVSVFSMVAAVVWSGNVYIAENMKQIVHVSVNGQEIGIVSDKTLVEQFESARAKELATNSKDLHMIVKTPEVTYSVERAFMPKPNDPAVLDRLSAHITAYPVGVEMLVDGKPVGVVKDQAAANQVLEHIKTDVLEKKKDPSKVKVLSAAAPAMVEPVGETELQKVEFVQKVELKEIPIQPQDVVKPDDLQKKLETGNVQPVQYTVEKGDCVSCIAKKLNIPKQVIYQNNPSIVDDMIKAGQKIDLTVLQPTLAVRTVEKVTEKQEIQFDTEYQKDNSVLLGNDQTIQPGKNGLKKVIIQLTKVNGLMVEETVQSEEIVQQPVKAVVRKGTKVVTGEGTGKFAWPVLSSSISSTFGYRWGALHKGVDLTSPNKTIMASDNGKVVTAGYKGDYGNYIVVDHLNGYKTLYGHLSEIYVTTGKIVEKGEKIGHMGSTGDSTGVHLHFEVQRNDTAENPLKYLNR
jgi:murein DD-endopeptidase MepM/ murein hydrolase activator NlpD